MGYGAYSIFAIKYNPHRCPLVCNEKGKHIHKGRVHEVFVTFVAM